MDGREVKELNMSGGSKRQGRWQKVGLTIVEVGILVAPRRREATKRLSARGVRGLSKTRRDWLT